MHDKRAWPRRGALRALILFGLAAASPATAATRGYTITSFDSIRIDAPVNVILATGQGPSARAEGDQAVLDRLHVDVSGRQLTIGMDRLRPGEKSGGAAILRLSTGMIDRVMLTGGGSVQIDRLKGLRGQIVLGGNGDITVSDVQLDRLDLLLAGGGRATLAGHRTVQWARDNCPLAYVGHRVHSLSLRK